MINNIYISGVVTTRDKNNSLPYLNIDYSYSNDSTVVTSGSENTSSITIWKRKKIEKKFKLLINLVDKIVKLFRNDSLDIEFIISRNKKIHILQVRKLVLNKKINISEKKFEQDLNKISKKIQKIQKKTL